ncbi:MAG: ABC transporter permease [Myxococcales bacterium]|nr:ABC transporter permease [Myxococcales bacterium]
MTLVGLAARNLLRNKVRTGLTVLGVAIAVVTFILIRTVVAAWTQAADFAAKDRVVIRHKVTFIQPLPRKYVDIVRQTPGIKDASWANWFGGKDPNHENEFFAAFAVDAKTYFQVVPELIVPSDQLTAFQEDKTGAVVGDVIAQKLGWKIGDKVTLESGIYPNPPDKPWTFTVRAIYTATARNVDRSSFIFQWDYLNDEMPETRKDEVGWIMSRVNDPTRTADVGVAIDKVFAEQDIQTISQDEATFQQSFLAGFSAILDALDIVSLVILIIMTLVLGNTIAMGVRERTSEFATMRAIGFLPKHVTFFILGEAAFLGAIGGALGLVIAFPFVQGGLGRWLEENMGAFFPFFRIPILIAVLAFVFALALGVLAALIPARGASRIKVTEALRRIA